MARETITLTYAGRRETRAGKLVHLYYLDGEQYLYNKAVIGAREAAKMAKAVDPFKDALRPLKDTYMNGTPVQRAALVTAIIREVTSWS